MRGGLQSSTLLRGQRGCWRQRQLRSNFAAPGATDGYAFGGGSGEVDCDSGGVAGADRGGCRGGSGTAVPGTAVYFEAAGVRRAGDSDTEAQTEGGETEDAARTVRGVSRRAAGTGSGIRSVQGNGWVYCWKYTVGLPRLSSEGGRRARVSLTAGCR